jgi:hypothetical protein
MDIRSPKVAWIQGWNGRRTNMKTQLPTPLIPFSDDELALITERFQFIENALEKGKVVVATRPHQILDVKVSKVIEKIVFHHGTDADILTRSGGAMNLLDPSYKLEAFEKDQIPEGALESMCLAHIGMTLTPEGITKMEPHG